LLFKCQFEKIRTLSLAEKVVLDLEDLNMQSNIIGMVHLEKL
jgi:hypothetical protein